MSSRIIIVDDHQIMRDGLCELLIGFPEAEVVGDCGDCASAWLMVRELRPDLALVDVGLPDGSGIGLTRRVRAEFPATKVIVLTGLLERSVAVEAIDAGAHGFLVKTSAATEVLDAIRTVIAGGIYLSPEMSAAAAQGLQSASAARAVRVRDALPLREGQVLVLIVRGLRNKEIAAELNLNVKTVETYRSRLMKRFDCSSPAELVRHALRSGLAAP